MPASVQGVEAWSTPARIAAATQAAKGGAEASHAASSAWTAPFSWLLPAAAPTPPRKGVSQVALAAPDSTAFAAPATGLASTSASAAVAPTMAQLVGEVLPRALPVLRDHVVPAIRTTLQQRAERARLAEQAAHRDAARRRQQEQGRAYDVAHTLRMRPKPQGDEGTAEARAATAAPPRPRVRRTLAAGGPMSFAWRRHGMHDRIDP